MIITTIAMAKDIPVHLTKRIRLQHACPGAEFVEMMEVAYNIILIIAE
ncbi:MAG: hypothetical protein V4596_10615 [Bdellovibrionota bacterium]